jgi:hypothetical protein
MISACRRAKRIHYLDVWRASRARIALSWPLECPGPDEPPLRTGSLQELPDDTQRSGERRLRIDRYRNTCKLSQTGNYNPAKNNGPPRRQPRSQSFNAFETGRCCCPALFPQKSRPRRRELRGIARNKVITEDLGQTGPPLGGKPGSESGWTGGLRSQALRERKITLSSNRGDPTVKNYRLSLFDHCSNRGNPCLAS